MNNKNRSIPALISLLLMLSAQGIFTIEIPLDRGIISGKQETSNIAFLDIDRVFVEHPMTKRLKDEFNLDVQKRKDEIQVINGEIAVLQNIIVSTTTEINHAKITLSILRNPQPAIAAPLVPGIQAVDVSTQAISDNQTIALSSQAPAQPITLPDITKSTAAVANLISADEVEKEIKFKEASIEPVKIEIEKRKLDISRLVKKNKEELAKSEEKQTSKVLADIYYILEKIAADENVSIIIDKNNVLYGQPGQDITDKVLERLQGR